MSKKKVKTKSKLNAEKEKPKPDVQQHVQENDESNPFDFGGLPNRDLKKNLGCG